MWLVVACRHELPAIADLVEQQLEPPRAHLPITEGLVGEPQPACGVFEAFGETAVYPVLGDRYRITLPADTFAEARADNIMAAPPSADAESRLVLNRGPSRLVVLVSETFGAAADDLAATVAANQDTDGSVARVRLASGLAGAIVEPTSTWGPPGGVLVGSGWFDGPDGTVINVWVLTTPDVAPSPPNCHGVARRILTSLAPGDAHLDLAGGVRTLDGFRITLPSGHVVTAETGPDFRVYRIFPIVPLEAGRPELGLYFGDFPSFAPVGTESIGELLGEPATWYTTEQEGWTRMDALAPAGDRPEVVHVFLSAPTPPQAESLRRIAETLAPGP